MVEQQKMLKVFRLINLLKKVPGRTLSQLANQLEVSERTIRRYFVLLEELGFVVDKHIVYKTYFIADYTDETSSNFTAEESSMLSQLVKSLKNNPLKESLEKKLYAKSDLSPLANDLTKAHLSKVISIIEQAIIDGDCLKLKNYSSLHSSTIKDRMIEPIGFTEDYTQLDAIDLSNNSVRTFKTERVSDIEVMEQKIKFALGQKVQPRDLFGNTGEKETLIELKMNFMASLLLKEEFPQSEKFISAVDNHFYFKAKVRHLGAVTRFVLGLIEDVEVLGSTEFCNHLNHKIKNRSWV